MVEIVWKTPTYEIIRLSACSVANCFTKLLLIIVNLTFQIIIKEKIKYTIRSKLKLNIVQVFYSDPMHLVLLWENESIIIRSFGIILEELYNTNNIAKEQIIIDLHCILRYSSVTELFLLLLLLLLLLLSLLLLLLLLLLFLANFSRQR